jgi:multidrug transporter EmrE-like cation transporter
VRRFWVGLAVYLALDVFATWASVRWLKIHDRRFVAFSFLAYTGCTTTAWLWSISNAGTLGITRAFAIYPVVALVATVLAGGVFSGERLSARARTGVALGVLSILLLSIEEGNASRD